MTKYLLYYSDRCPHSNEILKIIGMNRLNDNFNLLDISKIEIPQYIKSVPSLIIPKENGEADLLVGVNIFKWIKDTFSNNDTPQQQQQQQQQQAPPQIHNQNGKNQINQDELNKQAESNMKKEGSKDISDYDPCTMNGFSDNFSFLSETGPIDHNFSFLNSQGGGNKQSSNNIQSNPNELPMSQRQNNSDVNNQEKKDKMEKAYEQFMNSRNNDTAIPAPINRQ